VAEEVEDGAGAGAGHRLGGAGPSRISSARSSATIQPLVMVSSRSHVRNERRMAPARESGEDGCATEPESSSGGMPWSSEMRGGGGG
jgi:hypothetical protein